MLASMNIAFVLLLGLFYVAPTITNQKSDEALKGIDLGKQIASPSTVVYSNVAPAGGTVQSPIPGAAYPTITGSPPPTA